MMMRSLAGLLLLGLSSPAFAQSPVAIASYELQIYLAAVDPATGSPTSVSPIPLTAVTCNLPLSTPPTTTLVNPRFLVWADPTVAGRECRVDRSVYLLALPSAVGYRATMVALAGTTPEQRSARSAPSVPFALAAVAPAAPTGVGLRP